MATNTTVGSTTNRQKIRQCLRDFNFKALFVEELGWDILNEHPLLIPVNGTTYVLRPLVEKRGVRVFVCDPDAQGRIPAERVVRKIEREVIRYAYEHFIICMDAAKENQVWLWVKREQGKRLASRVHRYHKGQSGELLAQKLERLAIGLDEEERLQMIEVAGRVAKAFDVERVTKKFYDRFKHEHAAFLALIRGIEAQADREWYASLMLNRLMFIYFIQRKGFLDTRAPGQLDGDPNYLSNRLRHVQQERGEDQFHTFYRYFLLKLFHEGLSQRVHTSELETLLGNVPYLNGGLFDVHVLERAHPEITIPDEAFEQLFAFLDEFDWYLDDRPLRSDREINPDVLGYIFEKYINQKQMGAYYTKEDITEYISKNTIIPAILDSTEQQCLVAFRPDGPVWSLLRENPDAYFYDAVKKGCELAFPLEIEAGLHDVAQRGEWNKPAPDVYALPTETWREVVARRTRYQEVRGKLAAGAITSVNDLVTYNLDIRCFAEDVITYCTGTDLLRALYDSIIQVTVLDPTCGSGAFLFAALGILEGLYEACLERMQDMVEEREALDSAIPPEKRHSSADIEHFCAILERVGQHPSPSYFIYKSIIVNNLYGVDIMEEAIEICKLRLFLKLVSQVERFEDIEPLPDIDFNIRAGNTLVGFASYKETKEAIEGKTVGKAVQNQMIFDDRLELIEQKAQDIERTFEQFRALQTTVESNPADIAMRKQQLQQMLGTLRTELNGYLASEYGIDRNSIPNKEAYDVRFTRWQQSHQPFHWWIEFYGIMKKGGFDVIIGNPPYVEYKNVKEYRIRGYVVEACGDLFAFTLERATRLTSIHSRSGFIVPMSCFTVDGFESLQELYLQASSLIFISNWSGDAHPAKLFEGVDKRLEIIITRRRKSSDPSTVFTSKYLKWYSEERPELFHLRPTYEKIKDLKSLRVFSASVPKIGSDLDVQIIEKLRAYKSTIGSLSIPAGKHLLYYTRKVSFFLQFLDFVPEVRDNVGNLREPSELKILSFGDEDTRNLCLASLSSSLFYWYYIVNSDCRNLNKREIISFPIPSSVPVVTCNELKVLLKRLMDSYRQNSTLRTVEYANKGNITVQYFNFRPSKPIIDEIDHVLVKHYGFTDEELDFITNYDIKYRMGLDDIDKDEE